MGSPQRAVERPLMDLLGIAAIITALTGLLTIVLQNRRTGQHVKAINKAVNQVGPDEPPLTERVDAGFSALAEELRAHTRQDAENFAQLDAGLQALQDKDKKMSPNRRKQI